MKHLKLFENFTVKTQIDNLKKILNTDIDESNYWDVYVSEMKKFLENRNYKYVGEGRNRIVFEGKDSKYVIKIPKSDNGVYDNTREYNTYTESMKKDTKLLKIYPNVRLINVIHPLVVMEKLNTDVDLKKVENDEEYWWVDFIDLQQVGYNTKGKLKAYDFGW